VSPEIQNHVLCRSFFLVETLKFYEGNNGAFLKVLSLPRVGKINVDLQRLALSIFQLIILDIKQILTVSYLWLKSKRGRSLGSLSPPNSIRRLKPGRQILPWWLSCSSSLPQ
jgi:hypothetical protein